MKKKLLPIGSDFETIPTQDEDTIERIKNMAKGATVTPPKTKPEMGKALGLPEDVYKSMEAEGLKAMWIDKFRLEAVDKAFEEAYRKTSFSAGEGGEIISASFKMFGENPDGSPLMPEPACCYRARGGASEADTLKRIVNWLDKIHAYSLDKNLDIQFVGANVMLFDFRFLAQRCLINGVDLPKCGLLASRYDRSKYFDVLTAWTFDDNQSRVSLDRLCKLLGIETPKGDEAGPIHGGMVWDIWRDGGEDGAARIARYNSRDVVVLEPIYNKLNLLLGA